MSKVSHNNDVISRLVEKDMRFILEKVFLQLDCQELRRSNSVCKNWNIFLKNLFWKNLKILNILRQRLKENWVNERFNPNPTALMHICINGPGQSIRCVYPWYTWYDGKGA